MKLKNEFSPQVHENINLDPIIVSFIGPKKTGKTTLMKSLASHFLENYNEFFNGPLLIISNKHKPLIFIECPLDILSVANLAKTSDIVIFMIDGFFGLELETFECVSFLNSHGTPRVLSVVTHIDLFSNWKNLKKAKKRIKNRLKKELGMNLKIFFFSGLTYSGKYLPREITNLTRFFSLVNFVPSILQKKSSYMIVLKINILNLKNKEQLSIEGFVKGKEVEKRSKIEVHSPGIGLVPIKKLKKFQNTNNIGKFCRIFNYNSNKNNQKKKKIPVLVKLKKKKIFLTTIVFKFIYFFQKKIKKEKFFKKEIFNSINSSKLNDQWNMKKEFENFFSLEIKSKKNIFLKKFFQRKEKNLKENEQKLILAKTKKKFYEPKLNLLEKERKNNLGPVTVEIDVKNFPLSFFRFFDPSYPLILCFFSTQLKNQLVNGKVFRHKWNKKIIQSGERIYLSFGWNFFKTCVYFFSEKEGGKSCLRKYLKKSSEYSICFRGPNFFHETGLVGCFQTISSFSIKERGSFFNILFTGKVIKPENFLKVFKKIKIQGISFKNFNKTAYVKNIFSNEIEVRRFLGNKITGEEGEEGIIKNSIRGGPPGSFRAIFDRKIGLKEKIFLRIWIPLKFNNKVFKNIFFLISHDRREIQRKTFSKEFKMAKKLENY